MNRREFMLAGSATAVMGTMGSEAFAVPPQGKIPYRFFWTWDHSTNWMLNVPGSQTAGIGNGYNKLARDFEND